EARNLGDDARAPGVRAVELVELRLELGVGLELLPRGGEVVESGDERLGHEAPAELPEVGALGRGERAGHGRTARSAGWEPAAAMFATAWRGLPSMTRASPTRTTSAPARA